MNNQGVYFFTRCRCSVIKNALDSGPNVNKNVPLFGTLLTNDRPIFWCCLVANCKNNSFCYLLQYLWLCALPFVFWTKEMVLFLM